MATPKKKAEKTPTQKKVPASRQPASPKKPASPAAPSYPWVGDDRGYEGDNPVYTLRFAAPVPTEDLTTLVRVLFDQGPARIGQHAFALSWPSPDCLQLDGADQWVMDARWPRFCTSFRERVAAVHARWPVLAVAFGGELALDQPDANAVRARIDAEKKVRSGKGATLGALLRSGTLEEQLRAAPRARTLLKSERDAVIDALARAPAEVRTKLSTALTLYPRDEHLDELVPRYAHPALVRFLRIEMGVARVLVLDGAERAEGDALLASLLALREAGDEAHAAYEALVAEWEARALSGVVALHLAAGLPQRALDVVVRTPDVSGAPDAFEEATRSALEAMALDALGRTDEARRTWQRASDRITAPDALTARRLDWVRSLASLCAEKAGLAPATRWQPIATLRELMSGVAVRGTLCELSAPRTVGSKRLAMRHGRLTDASGSIGVIFWAETTERVANEATLEITDGYVGRDAMTGQPQLTLGKHGRVVIAAP